MWSASFYFQLSFIIFYIMQVLILAEGLIMFAKAIFHTLTNALPHGYSVQRAIFSNDNVMSSTVAVCARFVLHHVNKRFVSSAPLKNRHVRYSIYISFIQTKRLPYMGQDDER